LSGAVWSWIAVPLQYVAGVRSGSGVQLRVCAPAGDPHARTEAAPADLVGEHFLGHGRSQDVEGADERHVQLQALFVRHLGRALVAVPGEPDITASTRYSVRQGSVRIQSGLVAQSYVVHWGKPAIASTSKLAARRLASVTAPSVPMSSAMIRQELESCRPF
jgi:hypothetical protein